MADKNIVLLHGWGASTKKLRPLRKALKKREWNVYTPKLPGFDRKPPKKAWTVGDYAHYVEKKAQKKFKNKRYFIFGHSFGGRIAIKLAALGSDNLAGIILCSSGGITRANRAKRFVFKTIAKIGKPILKSVGLDKVGKKMLYKAAREHDYEKAKGVMRETFKNVVSEDIRSLVKSMGVPTLVLWGEEDKITPVSGAHFIKSQLLSSTLIVFKNQGHKLPYKKPKEVAETIDKWTKSL